ncbi:MAG: DHH family phosphoesterase, partial [Thermomicrobiales bacterium]
MPERQNRSDVNTPQLTSSPGGARGRAAARHWVIPPGSPDSLERLHDHPLLHALLGRRGIRTRADANAFLDHANTALPDPGFLPDIVEAVERIATAVEQRERIAVFGDYDVDGMTSAAIMWHALRSAMPADDSVTVRLPTREDGYGLNMRALRELAESGATLLIAVDCASTDSVGVAYAQSLGMDVIIIDHHHMTDTGPPGALTISPARPDGGHYRELSAAGLTLLVALALEHSGSFDRFRESGGAASLVDLAALGTVADVSPMTGYNRVIVREGIRAMRRKPRIGLKSLCDVASIDLALVNTTRIGFGIAP